MGEIAVDAPKAAGQLRLNGKERRAVSEFLAPYDIRLHADWARRRKIRQVLRGLNRISTLLLVDTVGLSLAYFTAVIFRQQVLPQLIASLPPFHLSLSLHLLPAALAVQLLSLAAFRAYTTGKGRKDYYRVFLAILVGTLVLFFGATLYVPQTPSQLLFVLAGIAAVCSVVTLRWLVDRAVIAYRNRKNLGRAALFVGDPDQIPLVHAHFEDTRGTNIRFVRSISFDEVDEPGSLTTASHKLTELLLCRDIEVVVVSGDPPDGMAKRLLDRCLSAGCEVMLVPKVLQEIPNPVTTEDMSGLSVLAVMRPRLGLPELALKRAFDFLVSLVGLVVLSPVLAAVAAAIKLDSRGQVFFRQRRVGVGGRIFWILKFRTMAADAEDRRHELEHLNLYGDGKFFKIKNDPRITRVGHFLRRTSLDEVPQLVNVLRGEMSLVGPRPPIPEEVADYSEHHLQRLSVTPGITGLWQINGRSDVQEFEEVVRLDLEYIKTWSLLRDLGILFRTFRVVLKMKGAA